MPSSTGVVEQTNPKPLSGLFALKPRQVLLAELNAKAAPTMNPSIESKSVLIHSILCFLDSNSFSKTLKRFLSEAKIQDDSWKACSFNLEEIFSKNFQTCTTKSVILEKEVQPEINGDATVADDLKKKKKKKHDSNAELVPNGKDSNSVDDFGEVKEKKKKKKKDLSESLDQVKEINSAELKETANNSEMDEQDKKDKDKKRRKNKSGPELHEIGKEQEQQGLIPSVTKEKGKKKKNKVDKSSLEEDEEKVGKQEKEKSKDEHQKNKCIVEKCSTEGDNSKEEVIGKEKSSKKRKRTLSEENVETEILQESKISDPVIEVNSVKGDNVKSEKKKSIENGHASEKQLEDSSVRRQDNEEDNSGAGRSAKKQRIDSEESKSASNAFRRVKVEDVVFTDERLQDNSYWAKDGADIGYGARAQEVLGQVKGRGFRHEKTKKKRGSYRGGQIDLDSHSIKFNYSDEE